MKPTANHPAVFFLYLVILFSFILFQFTGTTQINPVSASGSIAATDKISPALQSKLAKMQANEMTTVIVQLVDKADLSTITDKKRSPRLRKIILALKLAAGRNQPRIATLLSQRKSQGQVTQFQAFWIINGFSVTANANVIQELSKRPEVASITPEETFTAPIAPQSGELPEPNISLVNAPALWGMGYQGAGIVIANVDTGVYLNHPDLVARWRGGTNSWFDPNEQHPNEPFDINGHGTWTMGVMTAGNAGGTSVGVAPQAQWIAVKIFNDSGVATTSGIHAAYQWLLDPDGDSLTDDAPHVVNSSWSFSAPGCNLEFENDMQVLRAAGILPIFAAGNSGPNPGANVSPANNPSAFAVGATNNTDQINAGSGRGPSSCGEPETIFPEMVAPGVNIHSTDLYGLYSNHTGTSLAAPHVAGGLALLLSAYPDLTVNEQMAALLGGVLDLGIPGPDPDFGFGRLDLFASYQWLVVNYVPTETPTTTPTSETLPTATETPLPTFTSTPQPTFTDTPLPTATDTSLPTNTPTETPSNTPLPTATNTPIPSSIFLYLSLANNGPYAVGAVTGVRDEDILSFDGTSFAMFFDGTDVGVGGLDIDAFHILNENTLLISFNASGTVGGLGTVDDSDIVRFSATSLGSTTAGTFSMFLSGSSVGLTTDNEDVDALDVLPDGRLILSTLGGVSVPGLSGTWQDEDLLAFSPTSPGNYSSGTWSVYFDGSDVDLATTAGEDVDGVDIAANGTIFLSTLNDFSVNGITGANEDIFICQSPVTGATTTCAFSSSLFFDGSAYGLAGNDLDAFDIP